MSYSPLIESGGLPILIAISDYTVSTWGQMLYVSALSGNITITLNSVLPAYSGMLYIMKFDSSVNTVTIVPAAGQTIKNSTTPIVLSSRYELVTVYCDGSTDFKIINSTASQFVPDNTTIGSSGGSLYVKSVGDSQVSNSTSIVLNYSSARSYSPGNICIYGNQLWINNTATLGTAPSSPNWSVLSNIVLPRFQSSNTLPANNYTVTSTDNYITMDCTSGQRTLTFPLMASLTDSYSAGTVREFKVIKYDSVNPLVINLSGSETFMDGTSSYTSTMKGEIISISAIFNKLIWIKG